ncbi:hypothetical protein BC937DRAFT_88652 [Endogone sp. FLAS-F59071]|nr:hypothetical protein BC937DRAFT_88652 [Endogone sp. FLAS-F59071]|eukprot:RUS18532.1 hypothetical protein BC937DRAFT_88652 [Endogone sp. FLAS-F59071]
MLPCNNAKTCSENLHRKAGNVGPEEEPKERVAGDGTGLKVGLEVARVEVSDGPEGREENPHKNPNIDSSHPRQQPFATSKPTWPGILPQLRP